jgi:uncharacterized membrane protein
MTERDDGSDPDHLAEPTYSHTEDDLDAVADRPIGTRSFIYGTKTLATALVTFVLSLATDGDTMPAFWTLLSFGVVGVMFSLIERTTTRGAEVVSHRRVNIDVLGTVVVALVVNLVVYVAHR